jgi:dihydrolipoamide dehydrogenase
MRTNLPGVWAVGDVTGKSLLAHSAYRMADVAVADILSGRGAARRNVMRYDAVPWVVYGLTEAAGVGLTEQEARQRGMDIKIGKFRPIGLGKAHASGETSGLMKIVTEAKTGRIVGVHLVGSHAADLIHEAAVAMQMGATAATLAETIHAHPTMPEGLMEAAEDVEGMAIHLARRKVSAA